MFNLLELQLMRQSLDVITITGKDAKVVAQLQIKLEQAIQSEHQQIPDLDSTKQLKTK